MTPAADRADSNFGATVVRGAGLGTAGYFLTQIITLSFYVVLARLAGPEVFGAFAASWIIVGLSSFLTESGMSAALIQRSDRLEEAAATAVLSTFVTGIGLALTALAFSPLVGLFFDSAEIGLLAAAMSGILLVNAAGVVPDALMRRRFSFVRRVVVDPISAVTYGTVGVVALKSGMEAWGLVLATYASGIVRVSSVWILGRWLPDLHQASFAIWREMVRYARFVAFSELLRELNGVANTAILGRFLGIASLGAYRFGWRMATEAASPLASTAYMLLPAFARIADDTSRLQRAFLQSARLFSAAVFPVSVTLLVLGEQIVVTLLGERWREAGVVLAGLSGVTLAQAFVLLAAEVFKAKARPSLFARTVMISTFGSVLLTIAFLPLGAGGVAAGVSIAFLLSAVYAWREVGRVLTLPLQILGRILLPPALAATTMAVALVLLATYVANVDNQPGFVRLGWLALELGLGALVYSAVLLRISPATRADLRQVLRRLRRGDRQDRMPAPPAPNEGTAVEKSRR